MCAADLDAVLRGDPVTGGAARCWAFEQVGRHGRTVAEVARSLGVGWHTVMRAVRNYGEPVVDDSARLADVHGIGVDETAVLLATAISAPRFVTGIVDLTRGRPARRLDVVDGRFGPVLAGWLAARDPAWQRQVGLDSCRGYANALRTELGEATRVLDAFHTVRLGFAAVAASSKRRCPAAGTAMTRSTASAACCAAAPSTVGDGYASGSSSATRTAKSPSPGSSPKTCDGSTRPTPSTPPAATSTSCLRP